MLLSLALLALTTTAADALDAKVEAALHMLPLERKIQLIGGYEGFNIMPIPELGIPKILMNDGPLGVRGDNVSRPATAYPAAVSLASCWNPTLAKEFGVSLGRDALGRGVGILLGPGVNMSRVVQNGRNFEYTGEDPFLASRTAVNIIEGLQSQGVVATVKHLAANNHENDRFTDSCDVSERALRELYLPAFEAAVKEAHVGAVMCSYNKINGIYASENSWLLQQVLRKDWKFKDVLMSDWGAVHSTADAAMNGMDLEMPSGQNFSLQKLMPLVTSRIVPESVIDDKVRHILHTIYEFHLDRPLPKALHDDPRNAAVARRIAEEGTVLLKNANKILPLSPGSNKKVVCLGFNALYPVPVGGGSAEILPLHQESLFSALQRTKLNVIGIDGAEPDVERALAFKDYESVITDFRAKDGGRGGPRLNDGRTNHAWTNDKPSPMGIGKFSGRTYAKLVPKRTGAYWLISRCQGNVSVGLGWSHSVKHTDTTQPTVRKQLVFLTAGKAVDVSARFEHDAGDLHVSFGFVPATSVMEDPAKVAQIKAADQVIIGVGFNPYLESEGTDRPFELPTDQQAVIKAAIQLKKHIILVVNSGAGVDLAPFIDHVDAVLQAWYPGQEGAAAIADILTGKVNPSGKLATSFPRKLKGTYYEKAYPPVQGHAAYSEDLLIGYRWFDTSRTPPLFPFGFGLSFTEFKVSHPTATVSNEDLMVKCVVQNVGKREGADVAQVYVGAKLPFPGYPMKELKAFQKLHLAPSKGFTLGFSIPLKALAHWDAGRHAWRLLPGQYLAYVGDSSQNVSPVPFSIKAQRIFGP